MSRLINQTSIGVDGETRDMIRELAGDRPIYQFVKELVKAEVERRTAAVKTTTEDILRALQAHIERKDGEIALLKRQIALRDQFRLFVSEGTLPTPLNPEDLDPSHPLYREAIQREVEP